MRGRKRTKAEAKRKKPRAVSQRVDVRLTDREMQRIEKLVNGGHFFSKADFARTAVREKLQAVGLPDDEKGPAD